MKKVLAIALTGAMVIASLAGCATTAAPAAAEPAAEAVQEAAEAVEEAAEAVTETAAAGTHIYEQIQNIEDIVSKNEESIAVVIQPIDDTVESAIQQLVDAGIPYVAFDRIIEGVSSSAVSNVKGDNEGIGAACAAFYVALGMKPGDKVYVYEGDTSSVTTLRDGGFTKYLTGELEYDGKLIDDADKWTEADLENITYDGRCCQCRDQVVLC